MLAVAALGIGAAALLVVNPTFVVGAGFDRAAQARQLTSLQLNIDVGKIAGGALLGALAAAKMSYEGQFWVAAGFIALVGLVVWAASGPAAERVLRHTDAVAATDRREEVGAESTLVWAVGNVLRGLGGATLAILGAIGGMPYVAIVGAYLLFESTAAFSRIAQAPTMVGFAPGAAAIATGWLVASQALGQAGGSLGAGILAEATGSYEVLLWVAGGLGLAAGAVGLLVLVPAAGRRTAAGGPGPPAVAVGQAELAP